MTVTERIDLDDSDPRFLIRSHSAFSISIVIDGA